MGHTMQVKPADKDKKKDDRKLFVGMISKASTEDDLRLMFAPFGTIENVTVLRDADKRSKGCAFLMFENKMQAQKAIDVMHNSRTMEGCSSPVVVKFADTEKDKLLKRVNAMAAIHGLNAAYYQQVQQLASVGALQGAFQSGLVGGLPGLPTAAGLIPGAFGSLVAAAVASQQQQQQNQVQQPNNQMLNPSSLSSTASGMPFTPTSNVASTANLNPLMSGLTSYGGLNPLGFPNMQNIGIGGVNPMASLGTNPGSLGTMGTMQNAMTAVSTADPLAQTYSNLSPYTASFSNPYNSFMLQSPARQQQKEGPEGANLFIYHLPKEFQDADLFATFSPFGTVVSAKVFIDKVSGMSKCFGFVSYDSPTSAAMAIQAMNGFQIGDKRLKVQQKRPKDANRPY
ncbi:CUGBP Elav-like family member 3-A isoform X3 [Paramuricea clavata]|uniref:CUGBP Elav-like family member 3-A isoform X3 n=2 Tax=Paramuricea clavata TaxID=317549 RepID=A0A7D9HNB5_PARCT|nr:CUGBP Elav-like family member 3-A isoform X3 [Paramuricea clavata]